MVQNWLLQNAPGYGDLSEEERNAIMYFSFLWSLFEAQILNTSASPHSIRRKIDNWTTVGILELEDFEKYRNYFSDRYFQEGNETQKFRHLHFRNNDNSNLVERVLTNQTDEISEIVTALLFIIYRYRNNYFHGIKWAYNFEGQLENFQISNELLIKLLELDREITRNQS